MSKTKAKSNQDDIIVSKKIREFRLERAMTQDQLSKLMGVSIQQVQKYEVGTNRVSAGRLYGLAKIFKIHVEQFFDFINCEYEINDIYESKRGIKMLKLFEKLSDEQKKAILGLVKSIVESEERKEEEKDEPEEKL